MVEEGAQKRRPGMEVCLERNLNAVQHVRQERRITILLTLSANKSSTRIWDMVGEIPGPK